MDRHTLAIVSEIRRYEYFFILDGVMNLEKKQRVHKIFDDALTHDNYMLTSLSDGSDNIAYDSGYTVAGFLTEADIVKLRLAMSYHPKVYSQEETEQFVTGMGKAMRGT